MLLFHLMNFGLILGFGTMKFLDEVLHIYFFFLSSGNMMSVVTTENCLYGMCVCVRILVVYLCIDISNFFVVSF